jgi:1-acyl-sn-glycerol-3-phosphate acyltransferase
MALEAGIPILPVGVQGTEQILRKDSALVWPGEAKVRIGAPIDTAPYRDRPDGKEALMERVRQEIAALAEVPAASDQPAG